MKIQILKTVTELKNKFITVFTTHYIDTNNLLKYWHWVHRTNDVKAVLIAAIVRGKNPDDDKLCIIIEYRIPINGYEYACPAGLVDEDENEIDAVKRELKEETGLDFVKILSHSPILYNTAGLSDESISIYFVEAKGEISTKNLEGSEEIEPVLISRNDMKKLLKSKTEIKFGAKAWLIFNMFAQNNII